MQPTYWRLRLISLSSALALFWLSAGQVPQARAGTPAPGAVLTPEVQPLRPFGYVIGDVITQRIALEHEGHALLPAALPELERVGNGFQRRDVRLQHDDAGRHWLVIEYQIINVPDELRALDLPALDIPTTRAGTRLEVPAQPVTVAPLTPTVVLARAGLEEMRPDADAPRIDTGPLERRLHGALYLAAMLALAWLALFGLRQWRARVRLPLTRAARDMRHLDKTSAAAWQRLHRALDETAGQVVGGHNLPSLLSRAPWLAPVASELEQFLAASRQRFFAGGPTAGCEPAALCVRMAKLERRALS
jgi:mxaA protein